MNDLTAEHDADAVRREADEVDHDYSGEVAETLYAYADALAEGRVLPRLSEGERRIVLTTVNGEWPEDSLKSASIAMFDAATLELMGYGKALEGDRLEYHVAAYRRYSTSVLDALAGEGQP